MEGIQKGIHSGKREKKRGVSSQCEGRNGRPLALEVHPGNSQTLERDGAAAASTGVVARPNLEEDREGKEKKDRPEKTHRSHRWVGRPIPS